MITPTQAPVEQILSNEAFTEVLLQDKASLKILQKERFPTEGELVGVRLNLNILKTTGVAAQTLHSGTDGKSYKHNKGFYKGLARGYAQAVLLKNAYFNVNQMGREKIAVGESHKHPMASIDGEFQTVAVPEDFQGIEIKFNPKNHHLFVDANNRAIRCAEEVLILGHRAYARGKVEYHTLKTAPKRRGDFPSQTLLSEEPEMTLSFPKKEPLAPVKKTPSFSPR